MQSLYQSVAAKLLLIILHYHAWKNPSIKPIELIALSRDGKTLQTKNISIMDKDRHWKKNEWGMRPEFQFPQMHMHNNLWLEA
jgi:hypothetical protein